MPPAINSKANVPAVTAAVVQQTQIHRAFPQTPAPENMFPISSLPPELRHQIYTLYFALLPPVTITPTNASLPLHTLTPLTLSSPFFIADTPPAFYYQTTTFIFAQGKDLQDFSKVPGRRENVRRVVIQYGRDANPNRDWVHLMNDCFENLEEVEFVLDSKRGELCPKCGKDVLETWWVALRDAVREGQGGLRKKGIRQRGSLVLKAGGGEVGDVCERITVL